MGMLSNSRPLLRAGLLTLGVVAVGGLGAVIGCNRDGQPIAPEAANAPGGGATVVEQPGTGDTPALATFDTQFGRAQVVEVRELPGQLACTIRWELEQGPATGELRIDRAEVREGWPGFRAHLRSGDGQEFGFLIEWDAATEGREHIREWTATDRLDLDRSLQDGVILERYDVNGRQLNATLDAEGNLLNAKSVDASVLRTATLNGNATGDRLMTLLAHDDFGPWVAELTRRGSNGGAGCPKWLTRIATPCAYLKCTFGGGVANPLCHVCFATGWACWIAEVGCALADCD